MPADQAAGLRRRSARQPLRCIQCFVDSAQSTSRLALALHQRGWISLLVDARGRLLADSPARSLFGWRQQLERGQVHTLPLPHGDGWHAPGVRADEPAMAGIAQSYDAVVFDAGLKADDDLALMPGAAHAVVIEVNTTHESMLRAYTLLKTLSRADAVYSIGLLGAAAACDRVCAACSHFLDPRFAQAIYSADHEDGVFAALAVRMASEEAGLAAL